MKGDPLGHPDEELVRLFTQQGNRSALGILFRHYALLIALGTALLLGLVFYRKRKNT